MKLKYYLRGIGIGVIFAVVMLTFAGTSKEMTDEEIIAAAKKLGMVEGGSNSLLQTSSPAPSDTPDDKEGSGTEASPAPSLEPEQNPGGQGSDGTGEQEGSGQDESGDDTGQAGTENIPEFTGGPSDTQIPELTDTPLPPPTLSPTPPPTSTPSPTPRPTSTPSPTPRPTSTPTPKPTSTPTPTPKPTSTPVPTKAPESTPASDNKNTVTIQIKAGMTSNQIAELLEDAGLVDSAEDFDRYLVNYGYASNIQVGTYKIRVGDRYYAIAEKIAGSQ